MAFAPAAGVPITHRDRLPSSSRYELLVKIASGGMATVYVGRLSSVVGTSRLVAIKRAHAHLLEDPAFSRMLIAEAKLASRIHHPNVVAVQNVEDVEGELLLVMDYVEGASLADLVGFEEIPIPARASVRALLDACAGLQAAHELTDDDGKTLGIVHRDVSPHNILVGVDGVSRLTDFGIAKSSGHTTSGGQTSTGALKGKVAYMAPEYVDSGKVDARSDVFSLGIVAWEALTRKRLFRGATEIESLRLVLAAEVPRPSEVAPWLGRSLDQVIMKALARSPEDRFSSANELGEALEKAARREDLIATANQVGAYVRSSAGAALAHRRTLLKQRHDESEIITASARYDEVTRAAIDNALAGEARSALGRDENTASLPGASTVRPRGAITAPMPAISLPPPSSPELSLDGAPTSTSASALPVERESNIPPPDASTIGSGVSAQLVEEARGERRTRRGRSFVWFALAGAVAIGAAAMVVSTVRHDGETKVGGGESAAAAPTSIPPVAPVASVAPLAPSSAPAASSVAESMPPPPPVATAESRPIVAMGKPLRTPPPLAAPKGPKPLATPSAHPPPPTTTSPYGEPGSTPPPATTSDRAPPNPYAH